MVNAGNVQMVSDLDISDCNFDGSSTHSSEHALPRRYGVCMLIGGSVACATAVFGASMLLAFRGGSTCPVISEYPSNRLGGRRASLNAPSVPNDAVPNKLTDEEFNLVLQKKFDAFKLVLPKEFSKMTRVFDYKLEDAIATTDDQKLTVWFREDGHRINPGRMRPKGEGKNDDLISTRPWEPRPGCYETYDGYDGMLALTDSIRVLYAGDDVKYKYRGSQFQSRGSKWHKRPNSIMVRVFDVEERNGVQVESQFGEELFLDLQTGDVSYVEIVRSAKSLTLTNLDHLAHK